MKATQWVMTNIKSHSLIRNLLMTVVLLVVGIVTVQLFGQDKRSLDQPEVAQTPKGDLVEYVTKYHNQAQEGSLSKQITYPLYSQDKSKIVYTVLDLDNFVERATPEGVESEHKSYLYFYSKDQKVPKLLGTNGEIVEDFLSYIRPLYWLDDKRVLVQGVTGPIDVFHGITIIDLETFQTEKIKMNEPYIGTPILYAEKSKLYYGGFLPASEFAPEFSVPNTFWSYDFESKTTSRLENQPDEITSIIENYEKQSSSKSLDPQGQAFSINAVSAHSCTFPGTPTLYLPWPCNKAMCVERTGPQDGCGYNCSQYYQDPDWTTYNGWDYEYDDCSSLAEGSSYTGACNLCPSSCGHTRPAIDFGDGGLWAQTGTDVLASASGAAQKRYQATGAGHYVVVRHQKTSGSGYVYSYYMHLVGTSIPSKILTNSWVSVSRGEKIGIEGATGGSYSPHYHFEMRSADAVGNSYYPVFAEYGGCTPKTGRTYISKNVPTDSSMQQGFDCSSATTLNCASTQTIINQTTVGKASRFATYGNGHHNWDVYGPERIYRITTTQNGTISATLSNVSYSAGSDLDVFILSSPGSCSELDPLLNCKGTSSGLTSTYANATAGTYYIVVDGSNGSSGSYNMTINAPCSGGLPNLSNYSGSTYSPSGSTLTYTINVQNNGNGVAYSPAFKLYLSTDANYSSNDVLLAGYTYSGTLPNGYYITTGSVTKNLLSYVGPGNYYLIVVLDPNNVVAESNENNNIIPSASYFTVPSTVANKAVPSEQQTEEVLNDNFLVDPTAPETSFSELKEESKNWLTLSASEGWKVTVASGETITITNSIGQQLWSSTSREEGEVLLPSLPKGIYIVSICCDQVNREKVGKIFY